MQFEHVISLVGYTIEGFGVLVVVIGSCYSTVVFLRTFRQAEPGAAYHTYRKQLGRSIMLGLEFLIAGDIARTVVVDHTLENVVVLGAIILLRAFLSITLNLEVEGHWPWQAKPDKE